MQYYSVKKNHIFFQKLINETLETHDETYNRHFLDLYITKMKEELTQKGRSTYSGKKRCNMKYLFSRTQCNCT